MTDDREQSGFVHTIDAIDPDDVAGYGGKATGLARMASHGVPIPPAIVIGTAGYHAFHENGGVLPEAMIDEIHRGIGYLEAQTGRGFGQGKTPLLVSVRSGAAISMPGMMDTVLNLGLDAGTAHAWAAATGNHGFVLDSWTRFWQMYTDTVLDLDGEELLEDVADTAAAARQDASAERYAALEQAVIAAIAEQGEDAAPEPRGQLIDTVAAVFRSWDSPRAQAYREHHGIADDMGTAVTIQSMVFGNMDDDSGTGVAFSRDPNDGRKILYGEYLTGHQGEDIVAGTHTPIRLTDDLMPADISTALEQHSQTLERLYRDAVDIEFTVQSNTLYLLQVRAAKRTATAAVRIAADLVDEGLISMAEGIRRVSLDQVANLLRPGFDPQQLANATLLTQGQGASPGQTSGVVVLDSDRAAERGQQGEDVILVRPTTSPQDISGMLAANGTVTATGGALSHAAVVSRSLDKPCIVGCEDITVDADARTFRIGERVFGEGTAVSIAGEDGRVLEGVIRTDAAAPRSEALSRYLERARTVSGAEVWAAVRSESEAAHAVDADAEGLGLFGLSDLLMACGRMDAFTRIIPRFTRDQASAEARDQVACIVCDTCLPVFRAAATKPIHLRLPQLRSERARDLLANWEDIPASHLLALGSRDLIGAMLQGIAAASQRAGHDDVTVFAAGLTDLPEFDRFADDVVRAGGLNAGLLVQNAVLLYRLADQPPANRATWLDIDEIIRTAHGYPMQVLHVPEVLDDYCNQGFIRANPFRDPGSFLTEKLSALGGMADNTLGVIGAGVFGDEVLALLHGAGFRRFSASMTAAGMTRVKLARLTQE